jgi:hypothetical protein
MVLHPGRRWIEVGGKATWAVVSLLAAAARGAIATSGYTQAARYLRSESEKGRRLFFTGLLR